MSWGSSPPRRGALQHYEHGIWLVAYLLLVGSLAQYLLGRGQAAVLAPSGPSTTRIRTEVGLWNFGVVAVPAGILLDVRLLVIVGSVALLGALAAFRPSVDPSTSSAPTVGGRVRFGYWSLIVFMGISVFVGVALAWDIPWI